MDPPIDNILEKLANGEIDVVEARDRLAGITRVGDIARLDTRRSQRSVVPEIVDATGLPAEDVIAIAETHLEETGRAIVSDVDDDTRATLETTAAQVTWHDRSRMLVLHAVDFVPPESRGRVTVATAGTTDIPVAEQVVVIAAEMGCDVESLYDIGVSSLPRLLSEHEALTASDCVVVAAGREGALATVVAGFVDAPVIGLPVATGTGYGGDGEAALMGMLQSCTPLLVVNIDAGVTAGVQAARIARGTFSQ